jgi:SapC
MMDQPAPDGGLEFFETLEPLNPEIHAKIGLNPTMTPYAFARRAHAVPLIVGEFAPASLTFPVIFAGSAYQPMAVMSVRVKENLFINEAGAFPRDVYAPAFLRCYPFAYAQLPNDERVVLCIDPKAACVAENAEFPLFKDGEPTDFTKSCMDFCNAFETDRRRTEAFVGVLKDLDLFELKEVTFTPRAPDGSEGQTVKITEHFAVSEERIKALKEKDQLELLRSGAYAQIVNHWTSLMNWEKILAETVRRGLLGSA